MSFLHWTTLNRNEPCRCWLRLKMVCCLLLWESPGCFFPHLFHSTHWARRCCRFREPLGRKQMESQIVRSFRTLQASSPSAESSQQHWDVDVIFPSFFYTQVMNVAPTVLTYIVYHRLRLLSVLVSYCCCNKSAHTTWLQTAHTYSVTFLWVRCPGCFGWSLGSASQEARIKVLVSWALISGHAGCWQNPAFVAVRTGVPVSCWLSPGSHF